MDEWWGYLTAPRISMLELMVLIWVALPIMRWAVHWVVGRWF